MPSHAVSYTGSATTWTVPSHAPGTLRVTLSGAASGSAYFTSIFALGTPDRVPGSGGGGGGRNAAGGAGAAGVVIIRYPI